MYENAPIMPAGWHPDPGGQPGQRYHDGRRWTQHFVPTPPSAAAPAVAVAVSNGGGANHALHAVLTFLSCGMWLPIWILVAIFSSGSSSSVAIAPGGVVAKAGANKRPLYVAATLAGLVALGTAAEHPWLFVVLGVLGILGGIGFWALKSAQQREAEERREQFRRDMIADRADYENELYLDGDAQGTYGRYMPPTSTTPTPTTQSQPRPVPVGKPVAKAKRVVRCPLCDAEQRVPATASRYSCGRCKEISSVPA